MANVKISQLTPKGANLEATDLLEISEFNGSGYETKSITGQEIIDAAGGGGVAWGDITGTLSSQTDLQTALDEKQNTYGQEALSYSTDIPLGNIGFNYQDFTSINYDITVNFENIQANIYKSYVYRFTKWAYISWTIQSGTSWSNLTVNNEIINVFKFIPPSGTTGTITINSTVIGSISNLTIGCTYNLPNCEYIYSGGLTLASILTFTANALKFINGSVNINANGTFSLNSLETISGALQFGGTPPATFTNNSLLIISGALQLTGANMTSITLNGLKILGSVNLSPGTNANLFTTFSFTNIKEVQGNFTTNTTIGLSQTSVDHILVKLAALDGTNGTTRYANKTVTVRGAAPSATGLAAKATLVSRGCTVTTS